MPPSDLGGQTRLKNMIFPEKLKKGDEVRIIAPARSISILSKEIRKIADSRFTELGLKLSFGKHIEETDQFNSSTIESRIEDLHEAFADQNIKAVITVIGGFNSNQLLKYIDWELVRKNPKILLGFSDITVLNDTFFAKCGLVTYSGPHYATFGQKKNFDYTMEYFRKCLMDDRPFEIVASDYWSDDPWYLDQEKRELIKNPGYLVINKGEAEGVILGGNLCTLNLLQGTEYFPDLRDSVLFIEDDYESQPYHFDRDLQSLIHLPDFKKVKGLIIGRFQKKSHMTEDLLREIIKSKKELKVIPVVANADFGHSDPKITFPVGGKVSLSAKNTQVLINIERH